jgi:hypothetical protein
LASYEKLVPDQDAIWFASSYVADVRAAGRPVWAYDPPSEMCG